MMDFLNWYFTSLVEFWGAAIRIGLPQLLLVILLICWIRRSRCRESADKSCCWTWLCGSRGCQSGAGEDGAQDGDEGGDS